MSAVQHLRPPALERAPVTDPPHPRPAPVLPRAAPVLPRGAPVLPRGATARPRSATRPRTRTRTQALAALAAYTALAAVTVGRAALAHPAAGTIGAGPDVQVFLWGLRWWPYAIAHGLDPTVSHVVWGPTGSNVLWTTTVPLLSLLAAPITLTLGPAVAWNLLCVLAPALAAWGAFLLCRELTGAVRASLAGGLLFGFSSYELAEGLAHLHVTATLLVPLAALVAVRYMRGHLSNRGYALRVAMVAAAQFLIAPEILATLVLMALLSAGAAAALMPDRRAEIRRALGWGLAGLAGAGVVVAPVLVAMLRHAPAGPMNPVSAYSADLLNLVVPTRITALGGAWALPLSAHFTGNLAEQTAYLGVPLLLIVAAFAYANWAEPLVRLLSVLLAVSVTLSLGPHLRVGGHDALWLPGSLVFRIPFLQDALPARFALYSALTAAVMAALWLARPWRTSRWRWAALALCALSLAPTAAGRLGWRPTPAAVAHDDLARLVPPGATVISLPFWSLRDRALYAQAVSGMRFKLIDRWLQLVPASDRAAAESPLLTRARITPPELPAFERDMCSLGAQFAVVWDGDTHGRARYLAALRVMPVRVDGLLLYRLPRTACRQRP